MNYMVEPKVTNKQYCCEDFKKAIDGVITNTEEGEYDRKITQLDGWYIRGRPYDSWWGHFGRYKKFNNCPWCGKKL